MNKGSARKDARRNRAHIVASAREVFVHEGFGASTAVIARRAELSMATLYRHFPTRRDLVDAVFGEEVKQCSSKLDAAARDEDPWNGLCGAINAVVDLELAAPGFATRIASNERMADLLVGFNSRSQRNFSFLAKRLQELGGARSDISGEDIELVIVSARVIAMRGRAYAKSHCHRYITIVIEGLKGNR